jgi:hypothetical protein
MADGVFDISKGAFAEKTRDDATKFGILLLKVAEADSTLRTRATVAALLAASNTEANFTNYARKTALTFTLNVDTTNHKSTITVADQTWTLAGGALNNSLVKLVVFYEESGSDSGRIPISFHDFVETTNGSDLTATKRTTLVAQAA